MGHLHEDVSSISTVGPFGSMDQYREFEKLLIKRGVPFDFIGEQGHANLEYVGHDVSIKCDFEVARLITAYRHFFLKPLVNFGPDELACKCEYPDCPKQGMDRITMGRIQQARTLAGIPFNVNSAWRCLRHNRDVGSKDDSAHRGGYALDIEARNMVERGIIQGSLRDVGFNRFGLNRFKEFIHTDDDPEKPENLLWLYRADGSIV